MNLNEYGQWTDSVSMYHVGEDNRVTERDLSYLGLGIAGEAGEVADILKKQMRDGKQRSDELVLELGDVLWYWVRLCRALGVSPEYVMNQNVLKLTERKLKNEITEHK